MVSTGTAKRTVGGLSEEEALKNILDSIREYYEKYAHLHSTRFSDSLDVSNPKNWDFKEPTKSNLKGKSGIYIIYEKGKGRPIYVGSSTNLYNRITMLLSEDSNGHMNHTLTTKLIRDELASDLESACKFYHSKCSFKFLPTKNISEAVMLEGVFKELLKPEYNYEIMRSYPDFS
jgi:predicted GIY-YIG superfamily endonuclease